MLLIKGWLQDSCYLVPLHGGKRSPQALKSIVVTIHGGKRGPQALYSIVVIKQFNSDCYNLVQNEIYVYVQRVTVCGTGLETFLILLHNLCDNITAIEQVIAGYIDDEFQLENQSLSQIINLKQLENLLFSKKQTDIYIDIHWILGERRDIAPQT